jgi:hypothetical protein
MVSSSCMTRLVSAASLLAMAILAGCSSPKPTAPTVPENANVAGVWTRAQGDYSWTLVQSGTTVTGTGTGPHPLGVTITSTLTGSVAGSTFTFSEEQSWTINGQTQIERLHADEMRVTRGSMTGTVSFLPLFPPYRPVFGSVTMVRVVQGP